MGKGTFYLILAVRIQPRGQALQSYRRRPQERKRPPALSAHPPPHSSHLNGTILGFATPSFTYSRPTPSIPSALTTTGGFGQRPTRPQCPDPNALSLIGRRYRRSSLRPDETPRETRTESPVACSERFAHTVRICHEPSGRCGLSPSLAP